MRNTDVLNKGEVRVHEKHYTAKWTRGLTTHSVTQRVCGPLWMAGELLGSIPLRSCTWSMCPKMLKTRGSRGDFTVTQTNSEVLSRPLSVAPASWGNSQGTRNGGSKGRRGRRGSYMGTARSPPHAPPRPTHLPVSSRGAPQTPSEDPCAETPET